MDPDKRQRSLGMVDVVVDGTSVYPEEKASFLHAELPVWNYRYRCVLQVGHNQLFYAVKLRRKAQHGNSSSGRLSDILGDLVGFCDTHCKRSVNIHPSSIHHSSKKRQLGSTCHKKTLLFLREAYIQALIRVTVDTAFKPSLRIGEPPLYQYFSFL